MQEQVINHINNTRLRTGLFKYKKNPKRTKTTPKLTELTSEIPLCIWILHSIQRKFNSTTITLHIITQRILQMPRGLGFKETVLGTRKKTKPKRQGLEESILLKYRVGRTSELQN